MMVPSSTVGGVTPMGHNAWVGGWRWVGRRGGLPGDGGLCQPGSV